MAEDIRFKRTDEQLRALYDGILNAGGLGLHDAASLYFGGDALHAKAILDELRSRDLTLERSMGMSGREWVAIDRRTKPL